MLIKNYTKHDYNPKWGINPKSFKVKNWDFDSDKENQRFLKWDEEKQIFKVFDFDKKELWSLDMLISYAKFDPRNQWIWLVRQENENQVTILLYDYEGNEKASLPMEDPEGYASFLMEFLPEKTGIAIDFCYGQDGSQEYHFVFEDNQIKKIREMESDLFVFFFL